MNELSSGAPRAIDHCVLPVADLGRARARLGEVGFTLAPEGRHPFGTHNACIYLSDGTFLEPLAVADRAVADAAKKDNTFVARDRAWRDIHGEEGFSALVVASDDAGRDHAEFEAAGNSAGPMLSFSREFADGRGGTGIASFRLAFAAPKEGGEVFFFTCERVGVPTVDRSALEVHANGARAIAAIRMTTGHVPETARFLGGILGAQPSVGPDGETRFQLANGVVELRRGDGLPVLDGIVFSVDRLDPARDLFKAAGIDYMEAGARLIVPPSPGQGTSFLFEAS